MTVEDGQLIDFVAHESATDTVVLVMVEHRSWGDCGERLHELQAKLDTYLAHVTGGGLVAAYPAMRGKRIRIELRSAHPVGVEERRFLDVVVAKHLQPAGIAFACKVIGETGPEAGGRR